MVWYDWTALLEVKEQKYISTKEIQLKKSDVVELKLTKTAGNKAKIF